MTAGIITALQAQATDSQRVNVFVDGAFAIGISLNIVGREKLFVGKRLSAEEFARLEQSERADKVVRVAVRFLEARPRSTAEVRERLERKGFEADDIDYAVERLSDLGLLDDTAFARLWVENRQTYRPRGQAALRNELHRKGIDRSTVDSVLEDDALVGNEVAHVLALARGALRKYADSPNRQTFTRRMGGYLQRRGFGFETIKPVIDQLWEELQET